MASNEDRFVGFAEEVGDRGDIVVGLEAIFLDYRLNPNDPSNDFSRLLGPQLATVPYLFYPCPFRQQLFGGSLYFRTTFIAQRTSGVGFGGNGITVTD